MLLFHLRQKRRYQSCSSTLLRLFWKTQQTISWWHIHMDHLRGAELFVQPQWASGNLSPPTSYYKNSKRAKHRKKQSGEIRSRQRSVATTYKTNAILRVVLLSFQCNCYHFHLNKWNGFTIIFCYIQTSTIYKILLFSSLIRRLENLIQLKHYFERASQSVIMSTILEDRLDVCGVREKILKADLIYKNKT